MHVTGTRIIFNIAFATAFAICSCCAVAGSAPRTTVQTTAAVSDNALAIQPASCPACQQRAAVIPSTPAPPYVSPGVPGHAAPIYPAPNLQVAPPPQAVPIQGAFIAAAPGVIYVPVPADPRYLPADPYMHHFGPGYYRSGAESGHYRFPYYSYRRPWYSPGPATYNRNTTLVW